MGNTVLKMAVLVAAGVGFASAALAEHKITRKIPVDDEFIEAKVRWTEGAPSYEYRMQVIAPDGVIELCGAGVFTNAQFRRATTSVLKDRTLTLNGKPILQDFTFFTTVKNRFKLDKAMATCASTGVRVPKGKIEFGLGSVNGNKVHRID